MAKVRSSNGWESAIQVWESPIQRFNRRLPMSLVAAYQSCPRGLELAIPPGVGDLVVPIGDSQVLT